MKYYFYQLFFTKKDKLYVGIQYGKNADSNNLLTKYFTSCKIVKEWLINNEPCEIRKIKYFPSSEKCRIFERRYLKFWYNILGKEKFCEIYLNRNLAPGILFDNQVRQKMSISLKLSYSEGRHKNINNPPTKGKHHTEETKNLLSNKRKQFYINGGKHPRGMLGKIQSEKSNEIRRIKSTKNCNLTGLKGNDHPAGGTKWYNDGVKHIRKLEHPGNGWIEGRIFQNRKKKNGNN